MHLYVPALRNEEGRQLLEVGTAAASCESCECHVGESPGTSEREGPLAVGEEAVVAGKGWEVAEWSSHSCRCHTMPSCTGRLHLLELLGG